ncbi:hypothetical protein [Acidovorax kalamii]|uniref:hypothetical protein n=1 Tax=Acidovorax kalamii TaxID=2004485 RepID=UPI0013FDE632|nr:hypothetical protein [Acidovorax kalamii]
MDTCHRYYYRNARDRTRPAAGAIFMVSLTGFSGFIGAVFLIGGVYFGLIKYIETANKIIDGDQGANEQKAIVINVISALAVAAGFWAILKLDKIGRLPPCG